MNDRFAEGMHAVPPPMTGNYMPTGPEIEIDYSQFTYGPKQTQPSESESQSSECDTCESNISTEPSELVSEPVVIESNVESQPKVWSDAPIIEEYESDSEDECVDIPTKQQETPSFANQQVKTPRENVKNQSTHSQKPKVNKNDMGHGFVLVLLGEKGKLLLSPQQVVIGDHKDTMVDPNTIVDPVLEIDYPHRALKNKGIVDSGCSRHMTGNKAYLDEFQDFNGGPVAFGGSRGYITGKGKIKTGKLDFEDVCFVKELQHFNLFSVSQICDKKNKVLFTDSECLVLSPEFKLPNENQVLLKIPRQNNMYSFNLENIVPTGGLACLIAKATTDESNKCAIGGWRGPREEEIVFMDDLERLKKQEKEAYEEAEALRKKFETFVIIEGRAAKAIAMADFTNLETVVNVSPIPTSRIHSTHPRALILGDPNSGVQTRSKVNTRSGAHAFVSYVDAMQEELLQFEIQKVWVLVDLPYGKKAIGTKWVYRNKKDERGVVVRNKARLVAQGHRKEEGIDYDEVFATVARLEAIRIFLAFASYMGFVVYQMDVKSTFLYGKIDEEFCLVLGIQPTGGCQFLGGEYFWQCKKQTIVATSTTEAEYVAAASCCGQVLKIHTDDNVADLLTKAFDVSSKMAVLDSCPKHNMVAYLEKSEGNVEFHEIIDFLTRSSIFIALSVVLLYLLPLVEQFGRLLKSKTINTVRHITAKVAGKSVSISEASIRSDLLFDDADGIDTLPNQDIFDAIQRMGYEGDLTVASSERPSEAQPTPSPAPTSEVPYEPLTDSSPAQTSEVPIEHQPNPSPRPSPTNTIPASIPETSGENLGGHSSSDKSLSGNEGDMTIQGVYDLCLSLCKQVLDQAKEIQGLKAQITKLKKQAKPVIKHHKAYLKSVSLKQRFPRKSFSKKHKVNTESVSKQGRKFAKGESSVQRDPLFDGMPEDTVDHMETENAQDEGRTREIVDEDKEIDEVRLSTEDEVSTVKEGVSTDFEKVSTDRPIVSTDGSKVSTDRQVEGTDELKEGTEEHNESTEEQREGTEEKVESTDGQIKGTEDQTEEEIATQATQTSTQTPTSKIFGDDETIAKVLLNMSQAKAVSREKEKGVELKDVEETDRPKPTSTRSLLTLKPLPKIDPKDKGKKKIEEEDESESESDGIPQAEKKFKQLESDEELARKMQEEWEAEEERNRIAEENAANEELIRDFDDMKARIEADRLLAEKLQEQEREQFTIEERAKFLHDTIAAQRKFLAQQRSEAIRNKPPTKNQLRNQMMTYLKHVGNYKHAELKIKKFEEVQALYEKIKRSDEDFISIGSAEDERLIKRMNEKGVGLSKSEVIKEESKEEVQEEVKDEESTRKRKIGTRKKMKSRKRRYIQNTSEDDSDKENDELRLYLTIAQDEEKEVDYEILDRKYPIKEWKTECLGAKPQTDQAEHLEEINLNVVIRSNGQKRYFSTLMTVLSIFDREDLNAVYQLVMDKYQDEMPEGFDRVLWGDLMVLFNPDDKDEFWSSQLDWIIVSWKLHSSSGIHTLVTDTGLVIHMLVEKKYPLRKEVLMQMLKLKLESEEENTMALELIKFVKKILAELESEEHKNWLVHKQTACGKDFSNPFMVDNLPKIVRFSTHLASVVQSWLVHDQTIHELTIPEQMATGKGTSNPLMAEKTKLPAEVDRSFTSSRNDMSVWIHPL
ncbi:ribonuclease H-like domain-containing protein [Tanacetum coccineum]|uniref:Ribonuclease H-like domain-containing protein n=1 Tax=Tanacetum coccineum TaxID=301880 RepID=A0ABQ5FIB5_9ASTR